jgi:tyrosyl-tRNA synthetase
LAQKRLASDLTTLVHGEEGLQSAVKCTQACFGGNREELAKMSEEEIEFTFRGANITNLVMEPGKNIIKKSTTIYYLLIKINFKNKRYDSD